MVPVVATRLPNTSLLLQLPVSQTPWTPLQRCAKLQSVTSLLKMRTELKRKPLEVKWLQPLNHDNEFGCAKLLLHQAKKPTNSHQDLFAQRCDVWTLTLNTFTPILNIIQLDFIKTGGQTCLLAMVKKIIITYFFSRVYLRLKYLHMLANF